MLKRAASDCIVYIVTLVLVFLRTIVGSFYCKTWSRDVSVDFGALHFQISGDIV